MGAEEAAEVGLEPAAIITVGTLEPDFSVAGIIVWLPLELVARGAVLVIARMG